MSKIRIAMYRVDHPRGSHYRAAITVGSIVYNVDDRDGRWRITKDRWDVRPAIVKRLNRERNRMVKEQDHDNR